MTLLKIDSQTDTKVILSTLWIFVCLNYLYCDLMGLMDSNLLNQYLTGSIEGIEMSEKFLFYAAILMEIPMMMVVVSRIFSYKFNRILNIVAGLLKTIVMIMTLFVGTTTMYYAFFAIIEISTTAFIVVYAWRWRETVTSLNRS